VKFALFRKGEKFTCIDALIKKAIQSIASNATSKINLNNGANCAAEQPHYYLVDLQECRPESY
jgi:hypothetical protein